MKIPGARAVAKVLHVAAALAALIGFSSATCAEVPAAAAAASTIVVPKIDYKVRKLESGLTVYSLRDTTTPNVLVSMWYDVGSHQDPDGRAGFAHLFEHLLSRKTVNIPYEALNTLVEGVGGNRNANTNGNRTLYFENVPAQNLELALWAHAERMSRLVVDTTILKREQSNVSDEYRTFTLGPPYRRLYSLILPELLFDVSPNRRPTIGNMDELAKANLRDVYAFYEAHYRPDAAALIVAGNFEHSRLNALIDKHLASLRPASRKRPEVTKLDPVPRLASRVVTTYGPNVPAPALVYAWRAPGAKHRDVHALQVLSGILARGDSSRLQRDIVQKGLASEASADLWLAEGISPYVIQAVASSGTELKKLEQEVESQLEQIRSQRVSDTELAEARNEILGSALRSRETFNGRALEFGEALVRTGDPEAADKFIAAVQEITANDVQRVARRYLSPKGLVKIRYVAAETAPARAPFARNPVPLPKFAKPAPAARRPNRAASDAERVSPPAPGPTPTVTPPSLSEYKLTNGIAVSIARTGDIPLATMSAIFLGGASVDPPGKAGLANLVAALAIRGTRTTTAEQIASSMEALGATMSTRVTPDSTILSVTAPVAKLEAAGRILVDIIENARFAPDELQLVRKRNIDRLKVAMRNPEDLASLISDPILFGSSPYGSPPLGTPSTLESIDETDVATYHRERWHPALASVVIAGGIEAARARQVAADLFGNWKGKGSAGRLAISPAGKPIMPRTVIIDVPGSEQAWIRLQVRSDPRSDARYYSLLVGNAELGGGTSSRLFQEVRIKNSLAYIVGSGLDARKDANILLALAGPKSENVAKVLRIFFDELDRLSSQQLNQELLARRKAAAASTFSRQAETGAGYAAALANLIEEGLPLQRANQEANMVETVTSQSVLSAARRSLRPHAASIVIIGDASKFLDDVRTLRPEVEVIKFDELNLASIRDVRKPR